MCKQDLNTYCYFTNIINTDYAKCVIMQYIMAGFCIRELIWGMGTKRYIFAYLNFLTCHSQRRSQRRRLKQMRRKMKIW